MRLVLLLPLVRYSTYFEPVGGVPDLLFTITTWRQLGKVVVHIWGLLTAEAVVFYRELPHISPLMVLTATPRVRQSGISLCHYPKDGVMGTGSDGEIFHLVVHSPNACSGQE